MAKFVGRSGSLLLFVQDDRGVVVDSDVNMIIASGQSEVLQFSRSWAPGEFSAESEDLANAGLSSLDVSITASGSSMYTIPKSAQAEAKKALEWRKEEKRGGTDVGLNTARTLARGGQIGIEKVRHIAKYFARHEIDKQGKGWKPSQDGFPSNGRIAWALWGGDAAWRWAKAIVERENKKALTADGYGIADGGYQQSPYELDDFQSSMDYDKDTPEFLTRVRHDGSGMDRLYKIDLDNNVYVWDDGLWDNMGQANQDIWLYDAALDDPTDTVEKSHILIDPESAITIAARLLADPHTYVTIEDINAEEAELAAQAIEEIDWELLDKSMVAAAGIDPNDGIYSPEERAANASEQVRDATGKFATSGSRVMLNGDPNTAGEITSVNPADQTVDVLLDSGETVNISALNVQGVETVAPTAVSGEPIEVPDVDTSGILGEPRTPIDRAQAQLPGTLPAMTSQDITDMLSNWPAWVKSQRDQFQSGPSVSKVAVQARNSTNLGKYGEDLQDATGYKLETDAYDHPVLNRWLNKKDRANKTPNKIWYQPITAAVEGEPAKAMSPATSDVQPIYMAIVDPEDPRAVLGLSALVPASDQSTAPMTYSRQGGKWVRDEKTLQDLNSPTPPPVVPLDTDTLQDVLKQVDESQAVTASLAISVLFGPSLLAAGGLDRNRGGAEKLRRYWTVGKGSAKIRWGTPGDWTRCVRNLSKYMGVRSKGYCALRHKEMNGMWPGDRDNRVLKASGAYFEQIPAKPSSQIIEESFLRAHAAEIKSKFALIASSVAPVEDAVTADGAYEVNENTYKSEGAKFVIPLVIPEGMESGDGRIFKKGAIEVRDLPLPLLWQIKTGTGHDGSVVVGRIDHMEQTDQGIGNAYGVFDTGTYGKEAERLVREGFIRGVSADMDKFEAQEEEAEEAAADAETGEKPKQLKKDRIVINKARVMAVTIVPKPAFQECQISLAADEGEVSQEETMIPDGIYIEDVDPSDAEAIVASGMIAGAIPNEPPKTWFENPKLSGPTPLTVDDDGHVYGHIAAWHVDHIGMAFGTRPPRSRSKYGYFHTGVVRTEEGSDVPVGQLTLAGGHASIHASAAEAVKHYDDTASAIADIHAGEDQYGIWVAGALRPGTTPEQIRALRASAPSGDWRPIKGGLELVAICQVNVPGFPIARAMVAGGQVMALVAAGANTLAKMRSNPIDELSARIERLESDKNSALAAQQEDIRARFAALKNEFSAQPTDSVDPGDEDDDILLAAGSVDLAAALEQILAESVAFAFKAQGYHWNVKGHNFAEYHELFGEIYGDVNGAVDGIAENMLKLGYDAPFNLGQFASQNTIGNGGVKEASCQAMAYDLYVANDQIVNMLKMVFEIADTVNEQGIADFIAGRIDTHQKWGWQLSASTAGMQHEMSETPEVEGTEHEPRGYENYDYYGTDSYATAFAHLAENGVPEAAITASADDAAARVESFFAIAEFAKFSEEERKELAKKGQALKDGSYPIRNEADLKNAIRAIGRADKAKRASVRRHILKRAKALGAAKLVPEAWGLTASVEDLRGRIAEYSAVANDPVAKMRARIAEFGTKEDLKKAVEEARKVDAKAADEATKDIQDIEAGRDPNAPAVPGAPERDEYGRIKFTAKTQPRDAQGRFRDVLARLKQDLGKSGGQAVVAKLKVAENLDNTGNYAGAVEAVADLINTIDRLDTGALNKESLENITRTTTDLGKVIANLPLPFANQAQKVRYSDLPPALQDLVENMITKVEEKIGQKDADIATKEMKAFMSGSDVYSQSDISSQMNTLLRLLT